MHYKFKNGTLTIDCEDVSVLHRVNCSEVHSVVFTKNVKSIDSKALILFNDLENIYVEVGNPFYCANNGILYNREQTKLLLVPQAYKYGVSIPDTVFEIGAYAFAHCRNVCSVSIPNSVRVIGECAFSHCRSLKSVCVPNGVRKIEGMTFYRCSSLTSVELSETLESIGQQAFNECSSLVSINIPSSVKNIESDAFYNCTNLRSAKIPGTVKYIEKCAFNGCSSHLQFECEDNSAAHVLAKMQGFLYKLKIPMQVGAVG